jgi:single-stranded-DNA-specific exonuclease
MKGSNSWNKKNWASSPTIQNLDQLEALLLTNRNLIDHDTIQAFLHPALTDLHDPFMIKGMNDAVYRMLRAIDHGERIIVFGDFDTDGITSTAILVQALRDMGATVSYRIPDRNTQSHGLKKSHIDEIASKQTTLIITCDCGINDRDAISYAREKNIDVIVTDHHESNEERFPSDAIAVLNPRVLGCQYPEKNLSGAGIALKFVMALGSKKFQGDDLMDFLEKFFEICAIGLIADCVNLSGENRIIAKFGLEKMHQTSWEGLRRLLTHCRIDPRNIDEQTVGFTIAPRLNAASRIGDVLVATQLFLGEDDLHAGRITKLNQLNQIRREMTQQAYRQSTSQVREGAAMQFLFHQNWNPGILGLLAGRYSEELDVPVVAASIRADGLLTASGRAPVGYQMATALQAQKSLFIHFGVQHISFLIIHLSINHDNLL